MKMTSGGLSFPITAIALFLSAHVLIGAPLPPTNLSAIAGDGIVSLVWQRPDLLRTETYNVYRSTTDGNTGSVPLVTNLPTIVVPPADGNPYADRATFLKDFGDTTVTNRTTYYYQVTAVRDGQESAKSAQIQATPASASTAITKSRRLKIMPMGNSITGGWCAEGRCGEKGGYRGFLLDSLGAAGYTASLVGSCIDCSEGSTQKTFQYHEGWGSRTVADILRTVVRRALAAYDPDMVLLEIGTNNFAWGGTDVAAALKAYDSLLLVITTLKPDCKLLVSPITPLSGKATTVNSFNAGVKKKVDSLAVLKKNIAWVTEMESITSTDIGGDGVHPKCVTYQKMASNWLKAIVRVTDGSSLAANRDLRPLVREATVPKSGSLTTAYSLRGARVSKIVGNGTYIQSVPRPSGVVLRKRTSIR